MPVAPKELANQIDVYNIFAADSPLPQLLTKRSNGSYGAIYNTTNESVVAKVAQFEDSAEIEYNNAILKQLMSDNSIRPLLPFFKDDKEKKSNAEGIPDFYWRTLKGKDGKPTNFALQYMEKLKPVKPKSNPKAKLTPGEKTFVDLVVRGLEYIAARHNCYFTDIKIDNLMQRDTQAAPVLVDLDSFVQYNQAYAKMPWYGITSTYNVFNTRFQTYNIPSQMSQKAFNNVGWYVQRTACLCMLVDWLHRNYAICDTIKEFPSTKQKGETKHQFCLQLIKDGFTALESVEAARELLENFKNHKPFNFPMADNQYGWFFSLRSPFYDRTFL
jgi:hypothetical protein